MRYALVPFKAWHMHELQQTPSGESPEPVAFMPMQTARELEKHVSWTLITPEAEVVAAWGGIEHWPGRYHLWAYMTPATGPHMLRLSRIIRDQLDAGPRGRYEATVRADFTAGRRWVELLGFEIETPCLRRFGPFGEDHVGYVRIND